jgi:hypothetical protein
VKIQWVAVQAQVGPDGAVADWYSFILLRAKGGGFRQRRTGKGGAHVNPATKTGRIYQSGHKEGCEAWA